MRLCIFEDRAEFLEPLCLTRPIFDLRCGLTTLGEKQVRAFGAREWGALVRSPLEDITQQQHPNAAVNAPEWMRGDDVVLVNARWLPGDDNLNIPRTPCVGMVGDAIAWVVLPKHQTTNLTFEELPERLRHSFDTTPPFQVGGRMVAHAWDLVDRNGDEIRRDFAWLLPLGETSERHGLAVMGPLGHLQIAPSAKIEPMVAIDTTLGPVVIDDDALVTAFTRLEGPCYVGKKTQVLGAKIRAGTTLGPNCRVGGEVEASILHAYSNKYHEGFLGHSYIGEWVNLGAGTHNSDLRNDYGDVTMTLHGLPVHTGMTKVGCFLGDHVKTGLGTLFNTGTNVGAFCNLLPAGRFAPKYLPSFTSWWTGSLREAFTLDQLLTTAEIAMARRGIALTEAHKSLYTWLYEETADERRRVLRESEQRQLRKSA